MKKELYYDAKLKRWRFKGRFVSHYEVWEKLKDKGKAWVKSKSGRFYRDNKILDRLARWVKRIRKVKIPDWVKEYGYYYDETSNRYKDAQGRIVKKVDVKWGYFPVKRSYGRFERSTRLYDVLVERTCEKYYEALQISQKGYKYYSEKITDIEDALDVLYRILHCMRKKFRIRRWYFYAEYVIVEKDSGEITSSGVIGSSLLTQEFEDENSIRRLWDEFNDKIEKFSENVAGSEPMWAVEIVTKEFVFKGWDEREVD